MKATLTFIFTFGVFIAHAQDSLKVKQIDALVLAINSSTLPKQRDTIKQDHPEIGLKMTTYLTVIINGRELMKYSQLGSTIITNKSGVRQITASNSFYYDHNVLIKVEEYIIENGQQKNAEWYYIGDKPLYYTLKSDKAAERAIWLLTMSKEMVKQIIK